MEISFNDTDIIFIYGKFRKEVRKLEEFKSSPNCPFSKKDIDKEIAIYASVIEKLKEAVPGLSKMDAYKV